LADGPAGCFEVVDVTWHFSVTRLTLLTDAERTRQNMTLSLH